MSKFRIVEERDGLFSIEKKGLLWGWNRWRENYCFSVKDAEGYIERHKLREAFKKRVIGHY